MAEERGFKVDMEGFNKAKQFAKDNSGKKKNAAAAGVDLDVHAISELETKGVPFTDDRFVL